MSLVTHLRRRAVSIFITSIFALFLLLNPPPAFAALGFVGNMFPGSGSTSTINVGDSFDFYISVYKDGVTPGAGQGAGIVCSGYWFTVGYFGGDAFNVTETAMVYVGEEGNNDRYRATITPAVGLYQFTAWCSDDGGATKIFSQNNSSGDGRLVVKTSGANTCSSASQNNNDVLYDGLRHDSFSTTYRNPGGPVTTNQTSVTLKFRTCMNDLNQAPFIRVHDQRNTTEIYSPGNANARMTFDSHANASSVGDVTEWSFTLPIPNTTNLYYYVFRANDGSGQGFYRALNKNVWSGGYSNPGGQGQSEADQTTAYANSYQITIYDPNFAVPSWMQKGIVYQIFPDRFRDGDASNNPAAGRFFYNEGSGTIFRSNSNGENSNAWNTKVCDPRDIDSFSCLNSYSNNFYGGDLKGITDKINQGFFDNLGVSVLYLNPIFRSPSNHKYDTADYLTIDPDFGTLTDWNNLVSAANAHNIKIILDGVFNHTSSDSTYFDRYFRYNSNDALTSPNGIGTDDNSGACEAGGSPYYSWFYFPHTHEAGKDGNTVVYCSNGASDAPQSYEAWYGYSSLPKLQANSAAVRELIWDNGLASVGPYWTDKGAAGWRFDVGADVDHGLKTPSNDYWEGFRAAVRAVNSDTITLGEEWDDASFWLLGDEWDSVMNYRFRAALLAWLFTGCSGTGCTGTTSFSENDSNSGSSSGSIEYLSPSQFNARLRSIQEDYPPMAFKAMMNLPGSHDTQRVRFLLKKINNDNDEAAVQRMKEWWLLAFTYAGAPTLYYGDEVGLSQDGVPSGSTYQDDPYNRAPYPWEDTPGYFTADTTDLLVFQRKMASIRLAYPALQDGDVQHGILIDDANKMYGFARTNGSQTALIVLNRDSVQHNATLTGLNAAPYNLSNGVVLRDVIEGNEYTVDSANGGSVTIPVNATWGVVLLEKNKIETPVAPQNLSVTPNSGQNVLQWNPSVTDTGSQRELANTYTVHRSGSPAFTPDSNNLLATVAPSVFGTANGKVMYTDENPLLAEATNYYAVCSVNGGGNSNCAHAQSPTGNPSCPHLDKPMLNTPEDSSSLQIRRVTLTWSASLCNVKYQIIVRQASKRGERVDGAKNLRDTEFKTKKLERGATYFWRVRACTDGQCRRSAWQSFTIEMRQQGSAPVR